VEDEMGMGFPVAEMISSAVDEVPVLAFLKWAYGQAGMGPPTYIVVDADKAEANAIRAFGSTPVICYFHFCQALQRRLDTSDGGLPESSHDQFWDLLKSAQDEEELSHFTVKHTALTAFLTTVEGGAKFKQYWMDNWSCEEMYLCWARVGHCHLSRKCRTNNLLERQATRTASLCDMCICNQINRPVFLLI
jgi:hypothetical protein